MTSSPLSDPVVFRPTGFADLAGRRVGILGYGVEGRAAVARLRGVADVVVVDDTLREPGVILSGEGGVEALRDCEVVLKSPGVPRRRGDIRSLEERGVVVTSALNLWLHDTDRERVIAVTGTKGKSTTTALTAFFLHCAGDAAQQLGNIGQPPYDPSIDTSSGWLVLEVSSFQCVDIELAPRTVVVTALGSDHLDWHGSLEQYHADKLSLTRAVGDHLTLVADDAALHAAAGQLGGDVVFVPADAQGLASAMGLLGAHNDANVALALAAAAAVTGLSARTLGERARERAREFEPLRGRLTTVAVDTRRGVTRRYVDDGLATSVLATVAALEVFRDEPVALIAGGFDRGVPYEDLARVLAERRPPTFLVAMGDAGERLAGALALIRPHWRALVARTMVEAVEAARSSLEGEDHGVVLLSPAAPSFDRYRNWEERSDDFTSVVRSLLS